MKILRTIGVLAIVVGLVIGGTGNVFAKGPPDPLPGSGNHSSSKHGLFGTVSSVVTDDPVIQYTITLETQQGTVNVTINGGTKYKIPRQTHGPKADLTTFVEIVDENGDTDLEELETRRIAALVQFTNKTTADALRLMLIPITPPLHAHRVGIVTDFAPYTPEENGSSDGSIEIIDKDGVSHAFVVTEDTVYRPSAEDGGISELEREELVAALLDGCVTVVTKGDPKLGPPAKAIVLHEELPDWAGGKIIVDKVTDPSGESQLFDFALTGGPDTINQAFQLADATLPYESSAIKPGTYSVAETTVPDGWDLTGAVCSDGSSPDEIMLDPGETVTVTFTNVQID